MVMSLLFQVLLRFSYYSKIRNCSGSSVGTAFFLRVVTVGGMNSFAKGFRLDRTLVFVPSGLTLEGLELDKGEFDSNFRTFVGFCRRVGLPVGLNVAGSSFPGVPNFGSQLSLTVGAACFGLALRASEYDLGLVPAVCLLFGDNEAFSASVGLNTCSNEFVDDTEDTPGLLGAAGETSIFKGGVCTVFKSNCSIPSKILLPEASFC